MFDRDLITRAVRCRNCLHEAHVRLVLAESCTAGGVASALSVVPGISNHLCGSFVIYRNESKAQWLGVDRRLLDDPAIGPVSREVTLLLARATLEHTSEADVGAAVTGHVGPGVEDAQLDGRVFFALTRRSGESFELSTRLESPAPRDAHDCEGRAHRLEEAIAWVLQSIEAGLFATSIRRT